MINFLIFYLIGYATALVQVVADTYFDYKNTHKDIAVSDIFQVLCAALSSWVYVVACIINRYPKIWEATIIKNKQKK